MANLAESNTNYNKTEYLKTLYEENGSHNRFLIDWRHKVLVRFFVSIAAILFIAKWIWENNETIATFWQFIPFTMISILSLAFYVMDKRDRQFMDICMRVGANLEDQMEYNNGFYNNCLNSHFDNKGKIKRPLISFTTAFKIIYFGTAFISLFIAIKALFTL